MKHPEFMTLNTPLWAIPNWQPDVSYAETGQVLLTKNERLRVTGTIPGQPELIKVWCKLRQMSFVIPEEFLY